MTNKKPNRAKKIILIAVAIVAAIIIACAIYISDYYHADAEAVAVIETTEIGGDYVVFQPENDTAGNGNDAKCGLIFYPGGKVEYTAYAPLMDSLAEEGVLCVLVEMPFNLAVLDVKAADGIREEFTQIENWYIGGHSLGGSMAAAYLEDLYSQESEEDSKEGAESFKGLILLGSYSTADLSETQLSALSIYGSEDMVLNKEKYQENRENLPKDFTEDVIDGGCHAYFGMYGPQEGDGEPTITNEEQIKETVKVILEFLAK